MTKDQITAAAGLGKRKKKHSILMKKWRLAGKAKQNSRYLPPFDRVVERHPFLFRAEAEEWLEFGGSADLDKRVPFRNKSLVPQEEALKVFMERTVTAGVFGNKGRENVEPGTDSTNWLSYSGNERTSGAGPPPSDLAGEYCGICHELRSDSGWGSPDCPACAGVDPSVKAVQAGVPVTLQEGML